MTTVEEIVTAMEARYGKANRVWVMDRGMVSVDNVEWRQEGERRYILGAARSEIKKWNKERVDGKNWQQVRDGVDVKICPGPDGTETFLLCRSQERATKEKAMHERFSKRSEEGVASLGRRMEKSRTRLDRDRRQRQVGRLLGRNSRAAGRYQIEIVDDASAAAGVRLEWSVRRQWDEWAQSRRPGRALHREYRAKRSARGVLRHDPLRDRVRHAFECGCVRHTPTTHTGERTPARGRRAEGGLDAGRALCGRLRLAAWRAAGRDPGEHLSWQGPHAVALAAAHLRRRRFGRGVTGDYGRAQGVSVVDLLPVECRLT